MHAEIMNTWPGIEGDPALFANDVLGLAPTDQQAEFFAALARPGARVAVRSGHGTGKSTALAAASLWFLATRKDALVPCTAPTAHQLQDVLWREIRRLIARMPDGVREQFQTTTDRIHLKGSAGMIVARTARPENPDALQGFHAQEILFIIDEAAGVADSIFEVARGALSTPSARVALAGNPTRLSGYFHNAFHKSRNAWSTLAFSCLDSPLVAPEYASDIAKEYGADSDMYRVRVLGEFPVAGMNSLISLDRVLAAMERKAPAFRLNPAPGIIGVDPAWMGNDRTAAVWRRGSEARILFRVHRSDTVQVAEMVAREAARLDPDMIFVDQTGVGAGVYDQLRRTGFPVTGVSFSQAAVESDRFLNLRAEMWWNLRKWLDREDVVLEDDPQLKADLIGPECYLTGTGKMQLEHKDDMRRRGLPSPDLGDALALTFAATVRPRNTPAVALPATEPYSAYSWMERSN